MDEHKHKSMGCKVARPVCTFCGESDGPCEHVRVLCEGAEIGVLSDFKLVETSQRRLERIYELGGLAVGGNFVSEGRQTHTLGVGRFEITSVGIVEAPRCQSCGKPLEGCSHTHWVCISEGCESHGAPVLIEGVHPIIAVEDGEVSFQSKEQDDG